MEEKLLSEIRTMKKIKVSWWKSNIFTPIRVDHVFYIGHKNFSLMGEYVEFIEVLSLEE